MSDVTTTTTSESVSTTSDLTTPEPCVRTCPLHSAVVDEIKRLQDITATTNEIVKTLREQTDVMRRTLEAMSAREDARAKDLIETQVESRLLREALNGLAGKLDRGEHPGSHNVNETLQKLVETVAAMRPTVEEMHAAGRAGATKVGQLMVVVMPAVMVALYIIAHLIGVEVSK